MRAVHLRKVSLCASAAGACPQNDCFSGTRGLCSPSGKCFCDVDSYTGKGCEISTGACWSYPWHPTARACAGVPIVVFLRVSARVLGPSVHALL
jgi:hypothetical protein